MMRVLRDQTIELSHLTFHYREAGHSDAPPIILLHALMSDAHDWDEIMPALAARFHVFALEQRGPGTFARPGIYSFELLRDDLQAFADGLALNRFTLIGHRSFCVGRRVTQPARGKTPFCSPETQRIE